MDEFSLKEEWSDYDRIAKLEVSGDEDVPIVVSTAAPLEDDSQGVVNEREEPKRRPGGGDQFWLTDFFDPDKFKEVDSIEDFLKKYGR